MTVAEKVEVKETIVIYHVGGGDVDEGIGPMDNLFKLKGDIRLVIFDMMGPSAPRVTHISKDGIPITLVNACVFSGRQTRDFYLNKLPESSSLFPPAEQALKEHILYNGVDTWEQNTRLDRVMQVKTDSLDELAVELNLPRADVLSIDAQGAELEIMKGASRILRKDVLALQNEVEFFEIYAGQGLFHQQHEHLSRNGFRLFDIFNMQKWFPSGAIGKGFLTVGECVYFRFYDVLQFEQDYARRLSKLLKLCRISWCFEANSLSNMILTSLIQEYPQETQELRANPKYAPIFYEWDCVKDNPTIYR